MQTTSAETPINEPQQPQFNEAQLQMAGEHFRGQQNLTNGAIFSLVAAVAGAAAWAAVTVITNYQIGWMAVGVGFLVGMAMRSAGKGVDAVFGFVGAGFAVLGCVLGNFLASVYFVSNSAGLGYFETFARLNPVAIPRLMVATFSPMDLLFYAIAVYEGYKLSFRRIGPEDIDAAVKGVQSGAINP